MQYALIVKDTITIAYLFDNQIVRPNQLLDTAGNTPILYFVKTGLYYMLKYWHNLLPKDYDYLRFLSKYNFDYKHKDLEGHDFYYYLNEYEPEIRDSILKILK